MNVSVIGTGYVGLVTGACLAGSGNNVTCVDIDEGKIKSLADGHVPFYEPSLEDLVRKNTKEGRLRFTTDIKGAIQDSDLIFIAVGTPPNSDGSVNMEAVLSVARSIGECIDGYKIVVTKSTVPVGTTERIKSVIQEHTDIEFDVASNPEFLKEGAAVEDFMKPDRVIIGADKPSVAEVLKELYTPFMRSSDRTLVVSIKSSELAKYTANAMLATRISFMNEIANLCEIVGADISQVRKAIGSDARIGRHFLFPGVGYGGSCFPKDVKALVSTAQGLGYELKVCSATDEVNTNQRERFWKKIDSHFGGALEGKKIGLWGISFKPETDDIREAPSLYLIEKLLAAGSEVSVHDPAAMDNLKKLYGDKLHYEESNYDVCKDASALVINTEWNEYRQPDFEKLREIMSEHVIFDGRNLYSPQRLSECGFKYYGVGIGN